MQKSLSTYVRYWPSLFGQEAGYWPHSLLANTQKKKKNEANIQPS